VYHDMFGRGSIAAMQKTIFFRQGFKIQIHLIKWMFYSIILTKIDCLFLFWFNILLFCGGSLVCKSYIHVEYSLHWQVFSLVYMYNNIGYDWLCIMQFLHFLYSYIALRNLSYSAFSWTERLFLVTNCLSALYKGPIRQSDSLCWAKDLQVRAQSQELRVHFSLYF
jgi:hypothetical protein